MSEQSNSSTNAVPVGGGEDALLTIGTSEQQGEASMNEPQGTTVAAGTDGQTALETQGTDDSSLQQQGNLIQHIQIQPLGEEISQGETITLSLEEAQQLLQQHIVAGEGVEGVQPGIYQILSSGLTQTADGQMFITAGDNVSLLQAGATESLTGFESQNPGVIFPQNVENLQTQLEHDSVSLANAASNASENFVNSSEVHSLPATSEEQTSQNTLNGANFTLMSVPLENNETTTNQSASVSQSEKVLHIDFHVNQSGNLLQMTSQTEADSPGTGLQMEMSDSPVKGGGLPAGIEPISTATSAPFPVSWGPLGPVSVQSTTNETETVQSASNETQTEMIARDQMSGETTAVKHKPKQTATVTPKKPPEVCREMRPEQIATVTPKKLPEILPDLKPKQIATVTPKKPPEIRPDLSKPIEVKEEMEVVVKGKKCMLAVDPDTGRLTAYPILPPEGRRGRGRPRKSEQDKKKSATELGAGMTPETDQTSSAAEGLLELSNTGPDGIRRSGRVRKKAKTLDDYEVLEGSSDEEGGSKGDDDDLGKRQRLDLQQDYIPPLSFATPPPVKRGRGRPRRYPPAGQTMTTQIPTMIIPSGDGQTIMMAPIQGLSNLQAFQEQVKNFNIMPKNITTATLTSTNIAADGTVQLLDTSTSFASSYSVDQPITVLGGAPVGTEAPLLGDTMITSNADGTTVIISKLPPQDVPNPVDMANTALENPTAGQTEECSGPGLTDPVDPVDTADDIIDDTVDDTVAIADDTVGMADVNDYREAIESIEDTNRITVKNEDNQPTIIQIPENLLPMFMQKKEPLKLGLKSSEDELEKMKCIKCNFQAYYEQQYQTHIATHTDDVIKCKACNFVTFDKDDLLSHFKANHPKCICNVCDFMAEHAYVIKRHMMRHTVDGCRCDICGKCYKDQYVLKMHIKMVHMPAEVLFECMICSKKFTRKAHLKRHLRIHDPEKPFKCPHCIYRGCEKSDISKHLLIHEEPKHVCEVCGKAFRHIKNKELHLKRHNGQRDYKCGVCDFYGYTFTDIRKHIERKHTDSKTIICDKCGAAFKTDWHLREHQRLGNCEMYMIEQALAIATSDGGTSKATIQIPSSLSVDGQQMQINGQNIILDGNTGQFNIKVEQVRLPGENITLTEEQIQAAVAQGQIIDAANSEELIMEVSGGDVPVKLGHMGNVCLSDEEEENEEEEETEDDIHALERNMHGMVSEMSD